MTEPVAKVPGRAKGGLARAAALSRSRRQGIAQKAALARWHKNAAFATHTGILVIGDFAIDCANLNDGRRVFSQRSVNRSLGRKHGGREFRERQAEAGGELPIFLV